MSSTILSAQSWERTELHQADGSVSVVRRVGVMSEKDKEVSMEDNTITIHCKCGYVGKPH